MMWCSKMKKFNVEWNFFTTTNLNGQVFNVDSGINKTIKDDFNNAPSYSTREIRISYNILTHLIKILQSGAQPPSANYASPESTGKLTIMGANQYGLTIYSEKEDFKAVIILKLIPLVQELTLNDITF